MKLSLLVVAAVSLSSVACTHVAAYDRAQLAHPTMTTAELDGPAAGHVRAVHEGAAGGGPIAESGCGCN
jgi:Domain of unknown function (DUF4266)